MELEPPVREYVKNEIIDFLKSQLRGTIFPLDDIRRILSERLGWEVTLNDVKDAVEELELEGKVRTYVRL